MEQEPVAGWEFWMRLSVPPTYGTAPERVQGIIARGYAALTRAQEGAEDQKEEGAKDLMKHGFTSKDVVCGIAASRRTPYVLGAIEKARSLGAKTIVDKQEAKKRLTASQGFVRGALSTTTYYQ